MHASWAAYKFNLVVTAKLLLLGFENSHYGVCSVVYRRRLEILLLCCSHFLSNGYRKWRSRHREWHMLGWCVFSHLTAAGSSCLAVAACFTWQYDGCVFWDKAVECTRIQEAESCSRVGCCQHQSSLAVVTSESSIFQDLVPVLIIFYEAIVVVNNC